LLKEAKAPDTSKLIEELKAFLQELESKKAAQHGGAAYDASTIDGLINEYVRKYSKLDLKWRRVASRVFGILILVGRGVGYTALIANGGGIALLLHASAAVAYSAVILLFKIVGAILVTILASLVSLTGTGSIIGSSNSGLSTIPLPTIGVRDALLIHFYLRSREIHRSNAAQTPQQITEYKREFNAYDFVKTRIRSGMRVYNPFMKAHIPFVSLPKPSVIKYALSFIFTQSPTLEAYGDEVNMVWRDAEFDKALKTIYSKSTDLSLDNNGFKGNLFIGDGVFIKGTRIDVRKYVIPYKTIIDENGLPWTLSTNRMGQNKFSLLIKENETNTATKNAIIAASTRGNAMKRSFSTTWKKNVSKYLVPSRSQIGSRSFQNPAYDFTDFTAFRNAVYLAARYKLKAYGKPGPVLTENPLRANSLPAGWEYVTDDGEPYYECSDPKVDSVWDRPTKPCI
jgi:hypothetical protein